MSKCIDLVNQKFHHLTVKYRGDNDRCGHAQWWCECDCGNSDLILVLGTHLRNGHTQSCGCIHKQIMRDKLKKYNRYKDMGDYYIGYTNDNREFLFDKEDYQLVRDYCWSFNDDGYVVSKNHDNISIRLHRVIMKINDATIQVDHIHGISTRHDNRKYNLRLCSNQQNIMNSRLQSNNTSGVTGVTWDVEKQKWAAQIGFDKKNIHLGRFDNFDEAVVARKDAEKKYFGEFSYEYSQNL